VPLAPDADLLLLSRFEEQAAASRKLPAVMESRCG
jgi:hypothetical protein